MTLFGEKKLGKKNAQLFVAGSFKETDGQTEREIERESGFSQVVMSVLCRGEKSADLKSGQLLRPGTRRLMMTDDTGSFIIIIMAVSFLSCASPLFATSRLFMPERCTV